MIKSISIDILKNEGNNNITELWNMYGEATCLFIIPIMLLLPIIRLFSSFMIEER